MLHKTYIAVVLAVTVLAAEAATAPQQKLAESLVQAQQERNSLGITATVNDYVDETISLLVPLIQNLGLDPLQLPDLEEGFEVRYILIKYSAWLKLTEGSMTGLVNVKRSGDQTVNYFAKMLRVRIELEFTDIEFFYSFLVQVMGIGPTGGVRGSLDKFKVVTDILIDFNNDEIHLQQFALNDIGRLSVRLTGSLIGWLINPTISVIVRLLNTTIMRFVEVTINNVLQLGIGLVNSNLKNIINVLESYN